MKAEAFLTAERPLAQHCDALAARAPSPEVLAAAMTDALPALARHLAAGLTPLMGGDTPEVRFGKVEKMLPARLHKLVEPVAVNMLLMAPPAAQALASLDIGSALALTDQLFGGSGALPAPLPDRLPVAADLAVARVTKLLGAAMANAFELPVPMEMAARSEVLGKLVPARGEELLLVTSITIAREGREDWRLLVMLGQSQAQHIFTGRRSPAGDAAPRLRGALDAPFAALPLDLNAVLAELTLPVSRLSGLYPGATIPIAIGADIPLLLAGREIARGRAGSADGRLALRLTNIAWKKD